MEIKYFQQYIEEQFEENKDDYTKNKIIRDIACFFYGILHGCPHSNRSYECEILDLLEAIAREAVETEINNLIRNYPPEIEENGKFSIRNELISLVSTSHEYLISDLIDKWKEFDLYKDLIAEIEYFSDEENIKQYMYKNLKI